MKDKPNRSPRDARCPGQCGNGLAFQDGADSREYLSWEHPRRARLLRHTLEEWEAEISLRAGWFGIGISFDRHERNYSMGRVDRAKVVLDIGRWEGWRGALVSLIGRRATTVDLVVHHGGIVYKGQGSSVLAPEDFPVYVKGLVISNDAWKRGEQLAIERALTVAGLDGSPLSPVVWTVWRGEKPGVNDLPAWRRISRKVTFTEQPKPKPRNSRLLVNPKASRLVGMFPELGAKSWDSAARRFVPKLESGKKAPGWAKAGRLTLVGTQSAGEISKWLGEAPGPVPGACGLAGCGVCSPALTNRPAIHF